ncbi:MAG: hypothetical protein DRP63_00955, partial [Planctomycetota bacterium]
MVRWSWFIVVFMAAIVILPVGCRKKKKHTGKPYTLKPEVRQMDKSGAQLVDVTGNEYTFASSAPPAKQGDVIVGSDGQGYLRRVVDVIDNGNGTYTLVTEHATLEDVIQSGHVEAEFDKQWRAAPSNSTPISCQYQSDLLITGNLTISYDLQPSISADYDVLSGLKSFEFSVTGTVGVELSAKTEISNALSANLEWELPGFTYRMPFVIAGVPGVAVLKVKLCADVEATANASISTSYENSWSITAGARYENGSWTQFADKDHTESFQPPTFTASTSVVVRVYPKFALEILIAGVAGPAFHLSPYLEFNLAGNYPSSYYWALSLGLHGELHALVELFSVTLLDESFVLLDWSTLLADGGSSQSLNFTTTSLPDGTVGSIYSASLNASGGSPPYSFSLSSGQLPDGLNLASDGTISGIPTQSGTYNFAVTVTDSTGAQTTANFSITISPALSSLTITTQSLPNATENQSYTAFIKATGGSTPFFWSITSGTLPTGLNASQVGDSVRISGTPTSAGSYTFTVSVTDSSNPYQTVSRDFTIRVNPNPTLTITTTSLPPAIEGQSYFYLLTASGGTPPYNWSVTGLPQGLQFDSSTGEIYGTPPSGSLGSYTLTITVSDSQNNSKTKQITLLVKSTATVTWYVDATNGSDSNSGTSWSDAFKTIAHALDVAQDGETILVADGTYYEDNLDFQGKKIHLKSGNGPTNCIIDCQQLGRAFHFHSGETADSILEGFTIQNGRVEDTHGGAIVCENNSSPTITNCVFEDNEAADTNGSWDNEDGGAICCDQSSPTVVNCTFSGNSADEDGGAIYCYDSSPTITNCTFSGNSAYDGGAICCDSSSPTISNCTFSGNSATGAYATGGAICCYGSSPTIQNCTFSGNSADYYSGGAIFCWGGAIYCVSSSPTLTNCTFSDNSADDAGGAIYCDSSSPTITDCTFSSNSAGNGGAISCSDYSSPSITNCAFNGNSAKNEDGGAIRCCESSPTITNCTFSGNSADDDGGAICCKNNSSLTITNCTFSGNSADDDGGAIDCDYDSSPTITNCTFSNNSAEYCGGAICCHDNSSPTIANCTFSGNSAGNGSGGAIGCDSNSSPTIINCAFSDNSANDDGGAIYCNDSSSLTLNNCILWGNSASSGDEIYIEDSGSSCTLNYCCVD